MCPLVEVAEQGPVTGLRPQVFETTDKWYAMGDVFLFVRDGAVYLFKQEFILQPNYEVKDGVLVLN